MLLSDVTRGTLVDVSRAWRARPHYFARDRAVSRATARARAFSRATARARAISRENLTRARAGAREARTRRFARKSRAGARERARNSTAYFSAYFAPSLRLYQCYMLGVKLLFCQKRMSLTSNC